MSSRNYWTNSDGLVVQSGPYDGDNHNMARQVSTMSATQELVVDIVATSLADVAVPTNINQAAKIPANSLLLSASLIVNAAFTTSASGVLDIGLYDAAGAALDDDGIDVAIADSALTADTLIACDGAKIGTVTTADWYVAATYDTGVFTAGTAKLIVRYIKQ